MAAVIDDEDLLPADPEDRPVELVGEAEVVEAELVGDEEGEEDEEEGEEGVSEEVGEDDREEAGGGTQPNSTALSEDFPQALWDEEGDAAAEEEEEELTAMLRCVADWRVKQEGRGLESVRGAAAEVQESALYRWQPGAMRPTGFGEDPRQRRSPDEIMDLSAMRAEAMPMELTKCPKVCGRASTMSASAVATVNECESECGTLGEVPQEEYIVESSPPAARKQKWGANTLESFLES